MLYSNSSLSGKRFFSTVVKSTCVPLLYSKSLLKDTVPKTLNLDSSPTFQEFPVVIAPVKATGPEADSGSTP